jgi:hypothetical protein
MMGHIMTEEEAVTIATALAQRDLPWLPEFAFALRSHPGEWDIHFKNKVRDALVVDPATIIVIVDEATREAHWFPVL